MIASLRYRPVKNERCCAVVPIYRSHGEGLEGFNMRQSARALNYCDIYVVHPETVDPKWMISIFPSARSVPLPNGWFESIHAYSELCLTVAFYELFKDYNYILILQTDAILLRDDLSYWTDQNYDYIGAPIGATINVYDSSIVDGLVPHNSYFRRIVPKGVVGNGGLSLRRVSACIDVLSRHRKVAEKFIRGRLAEDIFFMFCGLSASSFVVPNEVVASKFSLEHDPEGYMSFNQMLPFGLHAWERLAKTYWTRHFNAAGLVPERD
jgi:hypothetical protein